MPSETHPKSNQGLLMAQAYLEFLCFALLMLLLCYFSVVLNHIILITKKLQVKHIHSFKLPPINYSAQIHPIRNIYGSGSTTFK